MNLRYIKYRYHFTSNRFFSMCLLLCGSSRQLYVISGVRRLKFQSTQGLNSHRVRSYLVTGKFNRRLLTSPLLTVKKQVLHTILTRMAAPIALPYKVDKMLYILGSHLLNVVSSYFLVATCSIQLIT